MLCEKKCSVCESQLIKTDIFRSLYKWDYQEITCHNCNDKLKPNWSRSVVWMFLCILPVGPLFNIFNTSTYLGNITILMTSVFLLLPLSILVGLCTVKIDAINE